MKLIDADRLIKDLRGWNSKEQGIYFDEIELGYVIDVVEDQPVAYDVDKVVEHLEELKQETFDEDNIYVIRVIYGEAIDIVKRGGIDG